MTSTSVGRRPAITSSSSSSLGSVASARATSSRLRSGRVRLSAGLMPAVGEAEPLQDRLGAVARLGEMRPAVQRADGDVLQHAQALERPHDLEGAADAGVAHLVGPQAGDRPAVEADGAGGRRVARRRSC